MRLGESPLWDRTRRRSHRACGGEPKWGASSQRRASRLQRRFRLSPPAITGRLRAPHAQGSLTQPRRASVGHQQQSPSPAAPVTALCEPGQRYVHRRGRDRAWPGLIIGSSCVGSVARSIRGVGCASVKPGNWPNATGVVIGRSPVVERRRLTTSPHSAAAVAAVGWRCRLVRWRLTCASGRSAVVGVGEPRAWSGLDANRRAQTGAYQSVGR